MSCNWPGCGQAATTTRPIDGRDWDVCVQHGRVVDNTDDSQASTVLNANDEVGQAIKAVLEGAMGEAVNAEEAESKAVASILRQLAEGVAAGGIDAMEITWKRGESVRSKLALRKPLDFISMDAEIEVEHDITVERKP